MRPQITFYSDRHEGGLFVGKASIGQKLLNTTHSFNTVAFLLPPFPFDLHSRKRSLYFDFYIRYLIQLVFCFEPPFFLSSIWLELLCLNISLFTVTSLCTLS